MLHCPRPIALALLFFFISFGSFGIYLSVPYAVMRSAHKLVFVIDFVLQNRTMAKPFDYDRDKFN